MKKKKSKFWLGVFSLVPGAGEMYLGFMKMGVSLMLMCGLAIALMAMTDIMALSVIVVTIYIYSFFHANNLGRMNDQAFQEMEDCYLFGMDGLFSVRDSVKGRYKKIAGGILVLFGLAMLWNALFSVLCDIFGWDNEMLREIYRFMRDEFPRILIGVAVTWGGIWLLRGKKTQSTAYEEIDRIPEAEVVSVQEAYARVVQQEEGKTNGTEDSENA
jgi:TM2 domain-containing membrane protein YozV